MTRRRKLALVAVTILVAAACAVMVSSPEATANGRGDGPLIYVTGQGLIYDSIVTADPVPPNGPFQLLEPGGPTGLQTEFGPGDVGYKGGRWKMQVNGGFHYFVCPLLPPGQTPAPG